MKTKPLLSLSLLAGLLLCTALPAQEPSLTDRTKEAVQNATQAVEDTGKEIKESFEQLWKDVDDNRLKNRSRDEIVAWALMGILVGAVAGLFASRTGTAFGNLGRVLLGLAGAFLGGMVVRVGQISFGWGPVLISYEELLFSLVGALVLVALARLIRKRSQAQPPQK